MNYEEQINFEIWKRKVIRLMDYKYKVEKNVTEGFQELETLYINNVDPKQAVQYLKSVYI